MPTYTLQVTRVNVLSPDLAALLAQRLSPLPLPFLAQANAILDDWIAAKADRTGTQMAADWAGVRATFHA